MKVAFDHKASIYDTEFSFSHTGRLQRQRVWDYLVTQVFAKKEGPFRILELNAGTGEDALFMAKLGHQILATDISTGMLDVCRRKLEIHQLNGQVTCLEMTIQQISSLEKEEPFDLIFSNFGGLNCVSEEDLKDLCSSSHQLLKKGGHFVGVIMSTCCPWEMAYFLLKGQPQKAFRRRIKGPQLANIEGEQLPVWYYDTEQLKTIFAPNFSFVAQQSIGLLVPPSCWESFFAKRPSMLHFLNKKDKKWMHHPSFTYFADHFLIHFRNTQ